MSEMCDNTSTKAYLIRWWCGHVGWRKWKWLGSVAVDGDERARCSVKSLRPADGISPTTRPDDPRVAPRSASRRLHRYRADREAPLTSSSKLLPPLSSLSWRFSPQAR